MTGKKTLRLLATGNSHLGAVKLAWDRLALQYPRVEVQFLGAPRETFDSFARQGSRFGLFDESQVPKRMLEGMKAAMPALIVDLADFDAVLAVGPDWGEIVLLGLLQRFGVDGIRPAKGAMDMLSAGAYAAFCADIAATSRAVGVVKKLALGPVAVIPRPIRSELILQSTEADGRQFQALAGHPDGMIAAIGVHQAAFARVIAGHGAAVIAQPAETLAPCGLTRSACSIGQKTVTTRGEARVVVDVVHMTADYGAIVLAQYLDRVVAGDLG